MTKHKNRLIGILILLAAVNVLFYYCGVFDGYSGDHYFLSALFPKNVLANLLLMVIIVPSYGLWLYVKARRNK